jgi:ankyrin repeat protein
MKYCCLQEKWIKLFKQKDGILPSKKDIFDIVMWSDSEDICSLYEECFDDDKKYDFKLKSYIFTEMIKITGTEFLFVWESRIKKYEDKIPLLHYCVIKNNIAFVCILIKHGVNINSKTNKNSNIFHACVLNNDEPTLLKYFLSQKNDSLNECDNNYDTALSVAIQEKKFNFAKILIDHGANLLIKNCDDICSIEIIAKLMLCECNCDKTELLELLAIILKRENTNHEVKKYFIDECIIRGKKIVFEIIVNECENVIDEFDILSRIIESSNTYRTEILYFLIGSKKYSSRYTNYYGITLLDYLLSYNYPEHIRSILSNDNELLVFESNNYKKNCKNNRIYTVFEYLFIKDNIIINEKINKIEKSNEQIMELLQILMNYGLDLNEKYFGYYPIEYAIKYCDSEVINKMIELKANIHFDIITPQVFTNYSNQDLLTLAVQYDNNDSVKLLIEHGIKEQYIYISETDKIPTSIIMAIMKDNYEIFEYLYLKYIDNTDTKLKHYLANIVQYDAIDNHEQFKDILKCEFDYEPCKYLDRIIQRFIPFANTKKYKVYIQLYQFTSLIVGFLEIDTYMHMHIWNVMEKYNSVLELIAPNNELLYSFINIITFVGGFRSDYIIKKYLCLINNLIDEDNNNKSLNWVIMNKFIRHIHEKGYLHNFSKIKSFGDDIKFAYQITCDHSQFDNLCNGKNKYKNINYSCNSYSCKKCQNLFHKENKRISYDNIFDKTKLYKISDFVKIANTELNTNKKTTKKNKSNANDEMTDQIFTNIVSDLSTPSKKNKSSTNQKKSLTNQKYVELIKDQEQECVELIKDQECVELVKNNNDIDYTLYELKKKLFKLFFPIKLEHYDIIYNQLCERPTFIENENELCFEYNKKVYTLFKNTHATQLNSPDRWIKYYAPNIGKMEKWDFNHDIPFWIDNVISKINCYTETIDDINNENMICKLYYFYGTIKTTNGYLVSGVFEYFINGTGTLFHRMFRQYYKLLPNLQLTFAKINTGFH